MGRRRAGGLHRQGRRLAAAADPVGQFGDGEPLGHRGGRLIWQLADADTLLVAWHAITWDEAARDFERRLLAAFAEQHDGRRPFANLTG
jgi:hypothetical protein